MCFSWPCPLNVSQLVRQHSSIPVAPCSWGRCQSGLACLCLLYLEHATTAAVRWPRPLDMALPGAMTSCGASERPDEGSKLTAFLEAVCVTFLKASQQEMEMTCLLALSAQGSTHVACGSHTLSSLLAARACVKAVRCEWLQPLAPHRPKVQTLCLLALSKGSLNSCSSGPCPLL